MPVTLKGSCHCATGAVTFEVDTNTPYPYQLCYCTICRKTNGGGGFSINVMGITKSLKIKNESCIGIYYAPMGKVDDAGKEVISEEHRKYCKRCGVFLFCWDKRWPEFVYPYASAINSDLPVPPSRTHMFLKEKASWVVAAISDGDQVFQEYPDESVEKWHKTRKLWID